MAAVAEARKAYEESWKVLNKAQDANKARETELAILLRADYHLKLQQLAKSIGFTPAPAGHKYKVNDEGILLVVVRLLYTFYQCTSFIPTCGANILEKSRAKTCRPLGSSWPILSAFPNTKPTPTWLKTSGRACRRLTNRTV